MNPPIDEKVKERLLELVKQGIPSSHIGERLGVCSTTVVRYAHQAGLTVVDGRSMRGIAPTRKTQAPRKLTIVRDGPNYSGMAASLRWGYALGG